MKNFLFLLVAVLVSATTMTSCVSNKKYIAATNANASLRTQNAELMAKLDNANERISSLEDNVENLQKNVTALGAVYSDASNQLDMSREKIIEQQKLLRNMQSILNAQSQSTEELRKKIADALVNFNTEDLSVAIKNGKVYVILQENLLFPSGSATVNAKGKEALEKLAVVLRQNRDINVNIEGHTDTKDINTTKYPDNWALSVGRSTAIARILIDDFNIDPLRVTASGHSKYNPVASNATEEGRALNRRTEIILEPKLDELMKVLRGVPATISKN